MCTVSLLLIISSRHKSDEIYENTATSTTIIQAINQASSSQQSTTQRETTEILTTKAPSAFSDRATDISAPYIGFYNISANETIYEKNANEKIHPASMTKILTAVTALTYMTADDVITVGSELELVPKHSSLCLIKKGHRLTLFDLLTGMLVASGNDAAYTIAVNTARHIMNKTASDEEALHYFTDLMNSMAEAIGCTDSNFTTPDGFDSKNQHTTVKDLALICRYAMRFKEIREISSTSKKKVIFESGENAVWSNSNKLLHRDSPYYFPQAIGMKTGTTSLAGKCLIAVANLDTEIYLAIVAGCKNEDERYTSALKLFELATSI